MFSIIFLVSLLKIPSILLVKYLFFAPQGADFGTFPQT